MKNKIIILDTETTDASEAPGMIQLGYIVCDMQFKELKRENLFFASDKCITYEAMAIHHITEKHLIEHIENDELSEKEKRETIAHDFKNAYLIAHNSPFDKNVLDCNGIETDVDSWIDTYNIACSVFTDEEFKNNLQYLRYALECEFTEEINPHDAMSDVIVLKAVFEVIYSEYKDQSETAGYEVSKEEYLDMMIDMTKTGIILRKWAFGKHVGKTFEQSFKLDPGYFDWMYNAKIRDGKTGDAVFNTLKFYLKR